MLNYLEIRPRKKRLSKLDQQQPEALPEALTVENSVIEDDPNEITVDSLARETKNISQLSLTLAVRSPRSKAKQHQSNSVLPKNPDSARVNYQTSPQREKTQIEEITL